MRTSTATFYGHPLPFGLSLPLAASLLATSVNLTGVLLALGLRIANVAGLGGGPWLSLSNPGVDLALVGILLTVGGMLWIIFTDSEFEAGFPWRLRLGLAAALTVLSVFAFSNVVASGLARAAVVSPRTEMPGMDHSHPSATTVPTRSAQPVAPAPSIRP